MIKLRKWSDSSDVDVAVLAEELEQLLLAVYEASPWTADQVAEVLRSDVNSCLVRSLASDPAIGKFTSFGYVFLPDVNLTKQIDSLTEALIKRNG